MKDYLQEFDQQILGGLEIGTACPAKAPAVDKILFCGMGGSAISGDVTGVLLKDSFFNYSVNRAAALPKWVDSRTLVIFSSYSGNAAEVLLSLPVALKKKASVLAVSAGGHLTQWAEGNKVPFLKLPQGLMPRFSIGYSTFALFGLFRKWGWVPRSEEAIRETVRIVRSTSSRQARQVARRLHGRSVYFYGMNFLGVPVIRRWRAQLAENSKMLASSFMLPEMFHNEIEGWRFPRNIIRQSSALFFRDLDDPLWVTPKVRAAMRHIRRQGGEAFEVASRGRSLMARLFSLIFLGDWASYELALMNHVDPMPIPAIETLKKVK